MKHTDNGEQYGGCSNSPYSHGLWNIKEKWRLYHRAGKADQVRPNGRPDNSHNVVGNTREKQLQMPKETSQKWSVDFSF